MYKRIITDNNSPPNNCIVTVHEKASGYKYLNFAVRSDLLELTCNSTFTLHECLHGDVGVLTSDKFLDVCRGDV